MFRRRFFSAEVRDRDVGDGHWSDELVDEGMSLLEWWLFVDAWAELRVWVEAP